MANTSGPRKRQVIADPTTKVRVSANDELDVWVIGEGVPVVFVHGGAIRDLLLPLAEGLTRRGRYQVIHYGRRGYGGAGLPADPTDIPGQANDIVTILDALGIDNAHVAGHSFGAYITLELASQAPGRLLTANLLEAPFAQQVQSDSALQEAKGVAEVVEIAGVGHYFPILKPAETAAGLDQLLRSQTPAQ